MEKKLEMMSVEEVSALVKKGELSPVQLVEACIAKTQRLNPELNAVVFSMAEQARQEAKKAEAEIKAGNYKGKLHGIPVVLKDLYYTKGVPTTAGSEVLRDFVPDFNGTVVQRLIDAGAIIMGKTNTHEFAFGPTTEESCFGPSRNPWNPKKITGGSSGGSGVAAATGMAYIGMGTDTGGSIRIPASMCGTVGFKPSIGRVSLYGIVPLSFSLDHPGPLCRSVADAAIAMDAITGTDVNDSCPFAIRSEPTDYYDSIKDVKDLKGRKFGIPSNFFFDKTDFEVERVFSEAIEKIKALGAEVETVEIPALDMITDTSTCIMFCEAAWLHRDWYSRLKDRYQPGVAERLDKGAQYSATDYIQATKDRETIMAAWEATLEKYDAILAPTCPIPAFDIGMEKPWWIKTRGQEEQGRAMATLHTRLANVTGAPALSLPVGLTDDGLPVGLMVMGRRNQDCEVLAMGLAYERNYAYPSFAR